MLRRQIRRWIDRVRSRDVSVSHQPLRAAAPALSPYEQSLMALYCPTTKRDAQRRPVVGVTVATNVCLDLRGIGVCAEENDEGELVLVLDDGATRVELVCGLPGASELVAVGAERLSLESQKLADLVRHRVARRERVVAARVWSR